MMQDAIDNYRLVAAWPVYIDEIMQMHSEPKSHLQPESLSNLQQAH
jgi:hypothetical protein